ncbi:glycosyltransferase [bacterium]|nr:glycosyltransferase [bacterium]
MSLAPCETRPANQASLPGVTIMICARNAEKHLARAIEAAKAQDYPGAVSLLVVDNGSTDATGEIARSFGATVIDHAIPGVAGARQRAWQEAGTEVVAFLDSDCEPPGDWLARAVPRLLEDEKLAAVGAKLADGPPSTLAEEHIAAQGVLNTDYLWMGSKRHFPFVVTAALVLRRAALERVGGFDESFGRMGGEDCDLCFRFREAGYKLDYMPEIRVIHHHRASVRGMMRQVFWYGQGSVAVLARWHHRLGWWARFEVKPPLRLVKALLETPIALLVERDRYRRVSPALRVLDSLAYMAGRWSSAIRHRVLCL